MSFMYEDLLIFLEEIMTKRQGWGLILGFQDMSQAILLQKY